LNATWYNKDRAQNIYGLQRNFFSLLIVLCNKPYYLHNTETKETSMDRQKRNIITFKADGGLLTALEGIENRSEFIRAAILQALENICPLCNGAGVLSNHQKEHWQALTRSHTVEKCPECYTPFLICKHVEG